MPRAFLNAREPFSSYSHFIGAVLSGAGLFILLIRMLFDASVTGPLAAASVVFCLSLIALYSASSVYHFSGRGERVLRRLKKLDHSMIYVLIAGSYTPIVLRFMPAPAIALLAAGGLAYTIGGVIYITKKPDLGALIGFHELFHLFVIAGSVCHYLMVFLYVL